jgi:chorismate dehydratase
MIRLGHIDYSNCIPVHALLLESPPADVRLVRDTPSQLNRALARGDIDAAPCSSIEYARHAGEYRILPAHAIGSNGPVQSILLESACEPQRLDGRTVAVPTASATSVVLLRILLETRLGVRPDLRWYDQAAEADPAGRGVAAVLRIGDVALRRTPAPGRMVVDLGAEWTAWTGLPFAFAVWQVRRDVPPAAVQRLVRLLSESRAHFTAHSRGLAERYAPAYDLSPRRLLDYWTSLRFDLDPAMQRGLLHFYSLAADLGEAPATATLDVVPASGSV